MFFYLPLGLEFLKSLAHTCLVWNMFMSALFYASLHKYITSLQDCACVMSNPCQQSVHTDNDRFSHSSCIHISISMIFSNCHSHAPLFSRVSISCFRLSLALVCTLTSVFYVIFALSYVVFTMEPTIYLAIGCSILTSW